MPLPAFHPPLGHARSISISKPRSTRKGMPSRPPQVQGTLFKARIAKAVGTTQLAVSGTHGQPNLSGSKRTWRSAVRDFHFQNQLDSLPAEFISQRNPFSLAGMADTKSRRAITASDVTQAPSWSSSRKVGQLRLGFCAWSKKS